MTQVLAIFTVEGDPQALLDAYDRAMPAVQSGATEFGAPQSHVCAATEGGVTIVDVWESAEAFERFAQHPEFARARREAGLPDPTSVLVAPVHAVAWPAVA